MTSQVEKKLFQRRALLQARDFGDEGVIELYLAEHRREVRYERPRNPSDAARTPAVMTDGRCSLIAAESFAQCPAFTSHA